MNDSLPHRACSSLARLLTTQLSCRVVDQGSTPSGNSGFFVDIERPEPLTPDERFAILAPLRRELETVNEACRVDLFGQLSDSQRNAIGAPAVWRVRGIVSDNDRQRMTSLAEFERSLERDHLRLGREKQLFSYNEERAIAAWLPLGTKLLSVLRDVTTEKILAENFEEVHTTCPGLGIDHDSVYLAKPRGFGEFPIRLFEITSDRCDGIGVHGLRRTTNAQYDRLTTYCGFRELVDEFVLLIELASRVHEAFGFDFHARIRTDERNKDAFHARIEKSNLNATIEDGTHESPDAMWWFEDGIGGRHLAGYVRIETSRARARDLNVLGRLSDDRLAPVVIEASLQNSLEYSAARMIEMHCGRLPLQFAPEQVTVIAMTKEKGDYAREVFQELKTRGIRCRLDDRTTKIISKERKAAELGTPFNVTAGLKEQEVGTVGVQETARAPERISLPFDLFLKELQAKLRGELPEGSEAWRTPKEG